MPEFSALVATFVAGLLSFASPCTAPLLPAYLTCISGVSATELAETEGKRRFRGRLVLGSILYIAGFATVFITLGVGAGGISQHLLQARRSIEIVGGILVILFGFFVIGVLQLPFLLRERRLQLPESVHSAGLAAAFPVGVVFGIGWTPCVGPYLGAALVLAGATGTALKGAILLAVYALGLGLPFILVSLAWASLPELPQRISRLAEPMTKIGGVITIVLGISVLTGQYSHITSVFARISTPH